MTQFFRANVGAVVCDDRGRVLAFERSDIPGAWQLPQGGLERDEEPEDAVLRELREEAGIPEFLLTRLGRHPDILTYELPEALRSEKTGRVQAQYWFYFQLTPGPEAQPRLPPDGEFRASRWADLAELASSAIPFRRPVYEKLDAYFRRKIAPRLG